MDDSLAAFTRLSLGAQRVQQSSQPPISPSSSLPAHHIETLGLNVSQPSATNAHPVTYQLLKACREGNTAAVQQLLQTHRDYNIDTCDTDGDTALLQAIRGGASDMVYLLVVDYAADIHISNKQGQTAFTLALQQQPINIDLVLFLLQCGARTNSPSIQSLCSPQMQEVIQIAEYSPIRRLVQRKNNEVEEQKHTIQVEQHASTQLRNALRTAQDRYDAVVSTLTSTLHQLSTLQHHMQETCRQLQALHEQESHILIPNAMQIPQYAAQTLQQVITHAEYEMHLSEQNSAHSSGQSTVGVAAAQTCNVEEMRQMIKRAMSERNTEQLKQLLNITRQRQLPVYNVLLADAEHMVQHATVNNFPHAQSP